MTKIIFMLTALRMLPGFYRRPGRRIQHQVECLCQRVGGTKN